MSSFNDFDLEIQDIKDSDPECFTGNVATAGVPVTLTPTNGRIIQLAFINVNSTRDPDNSNSINDAIKFSIDGGVSWLTLMTGESQYIPGIFTDLRLNTNSNGTHYQVILWS